MQKLRFLLLVKIALPVTCFAQFSSNSGNTTTSDKVGIGTTSPQEPLEIMHSTPVITFHSPNQASYKIGVSNGTFRIAGMDFGYGGHLGDIVNNNSQILSFTQHGYVGIGTVTPASQLEIKGTPTFDSSTILRITNNAAQYGRTNLVLTGRFQDGNDNWQFGTNARNSIVFAQNAAPAEQQIGAIGNEKFSIQLEGNTNALGFLSVEKGNNPNMIIFPNGNIAVGTVDTKGYKLAVAGSVVSESVTVKLQSQWPDYVFKSTFNLPALSALKKYIDQNKHLPDVPSESEVAKEGVNLGEMNRILLKKVEELTIYLIEKDRQLNHQQIQLNKQAKQLDRQGKQIERMLNAKPQKNS